MLPNLSSRPKRNGEICGFPYLARFCARCGKPQISPLRFAPVEMTKLGVIADQTFLNPIFIPLGGPQAHEHSVGNHPCRPAPPTVVVSHPCYTRMGHPKSVSNMDPRPPPIEGAPYLARSLRQMWETADLSTALRSGRDDKVRCNRQPSLPQPDFHPLGWAARPMGGVDRITCRSRSCDYGLGVLCGVHLRRKRFDWIASAACGNSHTG